MNSQVAAALRLKTSSGRHHRPRSPPGGSGLGGGRLQVDARTEVQKGLAGLSVGPVDDQPALVVLEPPVLVPGVRACSRQRPRCSKSACEAHASDASAEHKAPWLVLVGVGLGVWGFGGARRSSSSSPFGPSSARTQAAAARPGSTSSSCQHCVIIISAAAGGAAGGGGAAAAIGAAAAAAVAAATPTPTTRSVKENRPASSG